MIERHVPVPVLPTPLPGGAFAVLPECSDGPLIRVERRDYTISESSISKVRSSPASG
jgi:hypothetical protein